MKRAGGKKGDFLSSSGTARERLVVMLQGKKNKHHILPKPVTQCRQFIWTIAPKISDTYTSKQETDTAHEIREHYAVLQAFSPPQC